MNNLPISPDNALPIPAPLGLMELLIILTFIIHILFVNFTVSLVTGAVGLEIAGKIKKVLSWIRWQKVVLSTHPFIKASLL